MKIKTISFLFLIILGGCTSVSIVKPSEPSVIIVRNSSNQYLQQVSILPIKSQKNRTSRTGSVSPVPKGSEQMVVRPSNSPPLPKKIMLQWTDNKGRLFTQTISLIKILNQSTATDKEKLIFEILPQNKAIVYLE